MKTEIRKITRKIFDQSINLSLQSQHGLPSDEKIREIKNSIAILEKMVDTQKSVQTKHNSDKGLTIG
jgi:cob(I)alamin adenosyltransferase